MQIYLINGAMKSTNRRCAYCKKKVPTETAKINGLKAFCSTDHAIAWLETEKGKDTLKKARNKKTKEARERLLTRSDHIKLAQAAVNAFVRFRDRNKPCVSCGAMPEQKYGGSVDAGHYLSRGSRPNLRFNTFNIAAQCVKCNRWRSGEAASFRVELIRRIGLDRVERLESDHKERKFDIEYLKRLTKIFRKRLRIYKKLVDR
jgi:hypothetical protein